MTDDVEWPPQEDGDEELDDDWDWDTELGLLEPGPMLGPREAPQPFVPWPRSPRVRDRQLAVLTPEGVGEFLRGCRASAGMSQREVAEAAGVPHSTVSRVEAGRAGDVRLSTIVRLADACDVILVGTTGSYEPLVETDLAQRRRDAADRLLPAHLLNHPITADHGEWWADSRYTVNAVRRRPHSTFARDFRYRDLPDDG